MLTSVRIPFLSLFTFAAILMAGSPARSADFENLWTQGHGDLSIHYSAGDLLLGYELDDNAVINGVPIGVITEEEATFLTAVIPNASYSRFDAGQSGLPGVFENQTFWYIPQTAPGDDDAVPFLGIGAEEVATGLFVNDLIDFTLKSIVSSPANSEFIIYRSGLGGSKTVYVDTQNLGSSNLVPVTAGVHGHYTFGFSQPGTYLLEFEVSGNLEGGGTASGSAVYSFSVVPEPSSWLLAATAVPAACIVTRYRKRGSSPPTV